MTNDFAIASSAIARAEAEYEAATANAAREYKELGTSLRVANEERERLSLLYDAALDLLRSYRGGDFAAVEAAVHKRAEEQWAERAAARQEEVAS